MSVNLEGIRHTPFGSVNPYEQDPDERTPRYPCANNPVSLGVLTWPAGSAQRVWATVKVNSKYQGEFEGSFNEDYDELSSWKVDLPPFPKGAHVIYQLHASDDFKQIDTEEYDFNVQGWVRSTFIKNFRVIENIAQVKIATDDPLLEATLLIELVSDEHIRFAITSADFSQENVAPSDRRVWNTQETADFYKLFFPSIEISLQKNPFIFEIRRPNEKVLLSLMIPPEWLIDPENNLQKVRLIFSSPSDEGFYGFGERFNSFNQRGFSLDMRVYEQYKNQGVRTYLPVPFFLSSQGYGFFLNSNLNAQFDLANSQSDCWSVEAAISQNQGVTFDLFTSKNPVTNLKNFVQEISMPKFPPDWVFQPWMSSNEWNSQDIVMEQVHTTLEKDIPAGVVVIEAWSDETTFYIWNDAVYTPKSSSEAFTYGDFSFPRSGHWPDPKSMVDELHRLGMKVILWQIPVIKNISDHHAQHDADEKYMVEKGYCVKHNNGNCYRVKPLWFRDSLMVDFLNTDAAEWWLKKRQYLLDEIGIDGFKTDGGEHIWGTNIVLSNGKSGEEAINLYPNLYVGAYHQFASKFRNGNAITFSRAGFTGAQAYPCHWAGDQESTWEAFRSTLLAGLNAGLSGIPFWGWDLAGFSGEIPSAELYLRAAATAVFTPIMQYHSEYNGHSIPNIDRTPWNIADRTGRPEVVEIFRKFAKLRMQLLPYITEEARYSATSGEPLMRPLFLDWPNDPLAWQISDQYCFGRRLLVAPITQEGIEERRVYLPEGDWQDFWGDAQPNGNQWITVACPLDSIPVYWRKDS